MLRIPSPGGRVECRAADISCNPYLGAAMILAAGLEGVRVRLDPGPPNLVNAYTLTAEQRAERGLSILPRNLEAAIDAFAADPLSRTVFGDAMFDAYPPPSGKLSPVLLTTRGLEEMTSAALQRGCQS